MQENNEQVVTEEVKPIEVVPVDEIVGQPTETNNSTNNSNKGRSTREIVLIIIAALAVIAAGVYFAFFNGDDETASGNTKPETTEKEDKKETTNDETKKEDTNTNSDKKEETAENDELKKDSIKIAEMYVFATQFGLKTGKVADFDNKQLFNMTMLYVSDASQKCYDKQNVDTKAKELFGVELKSDDLPEGITLENNKYCKADTWGAGSNTNPLSLKDSKVSKDNNKVVYQHIYSYENNNTTIELEYKLENNNYVLVSVSKK